MAKNEAHSTPLKCPKTLTGRNILSTKGISFVVGFPSHRDNAGNANSKGNPSQI